MAEFMYADRIPAEILAWGNELAQIRRDIHQHPELGWMRLPCPTNLKMPGEVRLHSVVMPAAMTDM